MKTAGLVVLATALAAHGAWASPRSRSAQAPQDAATAPQDLKNSTPRGVALAALSAFNLDAVAQEEAVRLIENFLQNYSAAVANGDPEVLAFTFDDFVTAKLAEPLAALGVRLEAIRPTLTTWVKTAPQAPVITRDKE